MTGGARGMYGVALADFDGCDALGPVPSDWPEWRVAEEPGPNPRRADAEAVGTDTALLHFGDGSSAEIERDGGAGRVTLRLVRPVERCLLVHPYLSVVGMLAAYWGDRLALHGGAVVVDGRAWLFVSAKGGGKSTSLAALDRAGHTVLADDLSVIGTDLMVHRGPRIVDLRRRAAGALGIGDPIGMLGTKERWRHRLGDAPLTVPLGGVVIPGWGEPVIEPMHGWARLAALAPAVSIRVPGSWDGLLMEVAARVPVVGWRRRRDLAALPEELDRLVQEIGAIG